MSGLAPSTRTQYEVYTRGLGRAIAPKRLEKATSADIARYLRGLPSEWMRRRGLSALRGYFAALDGDDRTEGVTVGLLRGRDRSELAREALLREGWAARRIASATWGELAVTAFADRSAARATREALVACIAEAFPGRTFVTTFSRRADQKAFETRGARPRD